MIPLNTIYNESCMFTMSKLPNNSIDFIITSPPYDNLRTFSDNWEYDFEQSALEFYRIIKENKIVVWVIGDYVKNKSKTLLPFKQAIYFKEIGFKIYDIMIYHKNTTAPFGNSKRYCPAFEYMILLCKGSPEIRNIQREPCKMASRKNIRVGRRKGDGTINNYRFTRTVFDKPMQNVWSFNCGYNHSTKDIIAFQHSAIFPEKLCERHLLSWTNENDVVYDPFSGSGTTTKMCILNNRQYIGSEISNEYYKLSLERIKPYLQQTKLQL